MTNSQAVPGISQAPVSAGRKKAAMKRRPMTPTIMTSSVEAFVDEVVPILQRRGIYRTEYDGRTFRENLGL